jgi:hypothetical protein
MDIKQPKIIYFPKITDPRGNLSFIEEDSHLPFIINRICWIYDIPDTEYVFGSANMKAEELIVALSGSFDLVLHNGIKEIRYSVNRCFYGVLVPKMTWRTFENYATNSLILIIASSDFTDSDCIRDFEKFKGAARK